jgi:hypothetical protein
MVLLRRTAALLHLACAAADVKSDGDAALGPPADDITVDLSRTAAGPITYQGSGILYGFSADASLPPSNYSRAVKLQHFRGGGGHSAPGYELDQGAGFDRLWSSAEAMIKRAHAEGAKAILVICDLWAKFDGGAGRTNLPGQNSSWVMYDAFIDNIILKAKALDTRVAASIQFELWNEPARGFFGFADDQAAWSTYLQMWSRGFKRLRAAIPGAVIVGPSIWGGADPENAPCNKTAGLFNQWLDEVKASDTFPDVLSWHVLYDSFDTDYNPSPAWEVPRLLAAIKQRGLNESVKLMINEYGGGKAQDGPSSAAWWVANLERYNIAGCRSIECACCTDPNLSCMLQNASGLGDGSIVAAQAFTTTPIFDVYAAYASMAGDLVGVDISAAQTAPFDAVAAIDTTGAKAAWVLLGQAQNETGPYTTLPYNATVTVLGLSAASVLVRGGNVNVTVGGSPGYPLEHVPTTTMPVDALGRLHLSLMLGGPHANDWYFVKLTQP